MLGTDPFTMNNSILDFSLSSIIYIFPITGINSPVKVLNLLFRIDKPGSMVTDDFFHNLSIVSSEIIETASSVSTWKIHVLSLNFNVSTPSFLLSTENIEYILLSSFPQCIRRLSSVSNGSWLIVAVSVFWDIYNSDVPTFHMYNIYSFSIQLSIIHY